MESTKCLSPLRFEVDDQESPGDEPFIVEFEVEAPDLTKGDWRKAELSQKIVDVDQHISETQAKVDKLNAEIDRLTNHCDGYDYAIAVICGLVAGIIDSLYVGAWDFKAAKAKANKDINIEIENYAKKLGYKDNGQGLKGAIEFLEKKFRLPSDNAWKFEGSGISAATHHLDDFCHHPTLIGLVCNIIVQFTGKASYHNSNGVKITKDVEVNEYGEFIGDSTIAKLFSGVVNWFVTCAKTMANAKGHLMSDMAGSSQATHGGAGVPGSFMSTLKELSSLPIFNSKDKNGNLVNGFAESLRKAYQNGIGSGKSQADLGVFNCLFEGANSKFDARTERAVKDLLKKQAVPVMVNEALVRGAYFVRRLIMECKAKDSFWDVEWRKVLPFRNRTIARMMTIATGTFCACDIADATVRSGVQNGFNVYNPKFWSDTILRVNFVGIGRFAVAVVTDVGMGIQRTRRCGELIGANNELLLWNNAKMFYRQGEMWIAAEEASVDIQRCYDSMYDYYRMICETAKDEQRCLDGISQIYSDANEKARTEMRSLADQLKYLN